MNFETEVNYDLSVSRISEKAKLNYSKLNLTKKDFTKQLKARRWNDKKLYFWK